MTTSTSEMPGAPRKMWWHADLPSEPQAAAPDLPPEPGAPGDFLLEWILPTLADEASDNTAGEADRCDRLLRHPLRGSPSDP